MDEYWDNLAKKGTRREFLKTILEQIPIANYCHDFNKQHYFGKSNKCEICGIKSSHYKELIERGFAK